MSQKLPVNNCEWIKDISQFHEDFINNYNEKEDEGYFLEVDVQCLEKLHELHNDLPFSSEIMKIEKFKNLVATYMIKRIFYTDKKFKTGIKSWVSFKKSL